MKTWGIILAILGGLNLIRALLTFAHDVNGAGALFCGIAFIVLGIYLIHRAGQKDEEKKDTWSEQ